MTSPQGDDPAEFYDRMAGFYDRIASGWDASMARQGRLLEDLLVRLLGRRPQRVLDCACGIGTQALGLAARDFDVTASDLSPEAVTRARAEAAARGLSVEVSVADMTSSEALPPGPFDAVLAMDNPLAHLADRLSLEAAGAAACAALASGGIYLTSLRPYDRLRTERPWLQGPHRHEGPRRLYQQLWDWSDDGAVYDLTLMLLEEDPTTGGWSMETVKTRMYAWTPDEVCAALGAGGLSDLEVLAPEETGWYQPVVVGRAP